NACTINDTCTAGACTGMPKCAAPAHASPTCAGDGTCGFACDPGYKTSGASCVPAPKGIFQSDSHNGAFGGLAGADTFCQGLATAAGLPGVFKAWLSDSTATAKDRLTHAVGPYVLRHGGVVANDWADLTSGSLRMNVVET